MKQGGSSPARPDIRKVAVLGAGTMGSRIAAHIANAGLPVILLDIVPPGLAADAPLRDRSRFAIAAIEALKNTKPPAFYSIDAARLLTPGNFDDDIALIADCDWIIEAVSEDLAVKHALYGRLLVQKRPGSILTSNTSGLPITSLASALPAAERASFFGTHFFNPPRYMRLVEIIPLAETSTEAVAAVSDFCDRRLGKTVVTSRDTPNFIANRIGTFSIANAIRLMQLQGLTVEEVDVLTGSALGWPKTGTFRLADMVGIDVLVHVARNFEAKAESIGDERSDLRLPSFLDTMLERKWLGDKTGQGFYKKEGRDADGRDLRQALDWQTTEYRPATRPKFPSLEMAKTIDSTSSRIAQLLQADHRSDRVAAFYWPLLTELFTYAANRVSGQASEPAASIVEIDRAMRAGFNWELGPFEIFDAVGVRPVTEKMRAVGLPIASNVERLLAWGDANREPEPCWYKDDPSLPGNLLYFDPQSNGYRPVSTPAGTASVAQYKKSNGVVKKNSGASVVDIGDGVAAIELHSKMNALGGDIVSLITQTLKPSSEQSASFAAFVITGDSGNFSVGANLMQLLLAVQDGEWDEVDLMVRSFQNMTQAIKFSTRPVVVAPYGMCLGGGVEISLHAAARQAHAELYMGLVEAGVGLIPGGGGCKEMLLRSIESGTSIRPDARGESVEIFEAIKKNFETLAKAIVSTSAQDAKRLGFLRPADGITINRDRLLLDAKRQALALADAGYVVPTPRRDLPAPGESVRATLKLAVWTMYEGGYISEHDAKVANWIAHVLAGGVVAPGTPITEQYLLDLEREAFLSLCGERKTQERIAFTLKTGKPLRN
ncbi:MAG: 3-hydroxyacyl-CoA dehydrogenase NAD-binding domain-containing protein [Edaphobacter sp.]|uniref:3-hydroxyacyl-CoA dehydrogenase/enoyl-CoA hydratase family protein n=1 Tax=Edaphobacter sp. TaxID=1934404 RepID=UPI00239D5C63|nr:3-hydroxyacyl-CoA dehydrogenase/enoyl-CoA hydratase family protein [Edaphobacter sp.]MDE1175061.1 3-hydroxyacyl-CoA dehydrogenase NAD-binding domain-containing protein [Edaphobacter sp.]